MPAEIGGFSGADPDANVWWLTALDSLQVSLGRLDQHLPQLDRDLRQARADYRRLVELNRGDDRRRVAPLAAVEALTEQERRVATLVAHGRSNLEVAAELHVSVHTIKSQMCSILRKLDLRSRWELRLPVGRNGSE